MKQYVIIVAGGKGLRMDSDLPKQFILLDKKPVLMHTLERFYEWNASAEFILVLPKEHQEHWKTLCTGLHCKIPHTIADGGETRFQSVQNGLALVEHPSLVAVHDGVRPFVSIDVIANCFEKAKRYEAVIPVIPVTDSIRAMNATGSFSPADREKFCLVQTPQVFHSTLLHKAYEQAPSNQYTDDASVVEALEVVGIHLVEGNRENIKITTPFDLLVARSILRTIKTDYS